MTLGLGVAMGVEINGFCDERFRPFEEAFRANFDDGYELGAALAVTHQGRTVVDLRGGWADLARTRPWREDTLVHVASTTKVMVALCMLMLVDRGLIALDAPGTTRRPFRSSSGAPVAARPASIAVKRPLLMPMSARPTRSTMAALRRMRSKVMGGSLS
eukprot:gene40536-biopygen27304